MIGQYKYEASKLRRFNKSAGAQTELVGRIAHPDLMRQHLFMDVRASDLSYHNVIKLFEPIPAGFIPIITKHCDTCRKHFM
jgi:hypothetical protein